jgi:hypothetical protein
MKRLALILALLLALGCATTAPPTPSPTPVPSPTAQAVSSSSPTPVSSLTEQAVSSPTPAAAQPQTSAATPIPVPASGSMEPVDVVRSLMDAVEQLDTEAASEYLCAAQDIQFEDELKEGFGESEAMGLDPDELMAALMLDVKDMTYEEVSRGDAQAVVHMAGSMKVEFDAEQLKAILKAGAEAQGQTLSDEQAALFITMFNAMATQEFPLEGDVELIVENGTWVVCDDLDLLGEN